MARRASELLSDEVRERIARLDIAAQTLVEGAISGLHKSPYQGFSVEFAQHREYTWGDELKHVDWKVYGRTDRYYVKQYEEETNLYALCALDASESMVYRGERAALSKYEYGATLAAGIAYLLLRQQDAVGLSLFAEQELRRLPMSAHPAQLRLMAEAMAAVEPTAESGRPPVLHRLAEELVRRGMVFVISDCLFDAGALLDGVRHLRHRGHEVVVLHLLDPDELDFPFDDVTRFEGLEQGPQLLIDPRGLRDSYLSALGAFLQTVETGCQEARVDYLRVDTRRSPALSLARYLTLRRRRRGGARR